MSRLRELIDDYKWDLQKIVAQLESCDYSCEAGVLVNNVAFVALKEMAEDLDRGDSSVERPD
jgi:hypothetical protein